MSSSRESISNAQIRADLYAEGDYILHLDSDVFVLHEVTYEDIFHLGKPVLPYRRYRDDSPEGEPPFSEQYPQHHYKQTYRNKSKEFWTLILGPFLGVKAILLLYCSSFAPTIVLWF